jgi:hypothetical protein
VVTKVGLAGQMEQRTPLLGERALGCVEVLALTHERSADHDEGKVDE